MEASKPPEASTPPEASRPPEASTPPLPDTMPISNSSQESGLWLWRGEAPSPPPAPSVSPPSRIERVAVPIISAARSARWMAVPSGLALVGLAAWVALQLLRGGQSIPGSTPVAAPQPAPTPSLARPISPAPPPITDALLDQVEPPSAPVTQAMAEPTQRKTVKWRARRTSRLAARRSHAWFARSRTPLSIAPCRYQCDWADGTGWHGGGY